MKDFKNPKVLRIAKKVAEKGVCDHCLGRQLAQVSTGMTNQDRGRILRSHINSEESRCSICDDIFKKLEKFTAEAKKIVSGIEFSTFIAANRLSSDLVKREETLWEDAGIEYCEPIKSELNREFGKLLHKNLKKEVDENNPNIIIILNLQKESLELDIRPVFIYGKYQKLVRGIPQTKWDTYKETVEDIIAKPLMKASKAESHSMHGAGREDIDALCLAKRPFVFELGSPKIRKIPLKSLNQQINKSRKVKVHGLRFSNKKEVIQVKALKSDKSYRALVIFEKTVKKQQLSDLKKLIGIINQKTPSRVLHRRADLLRKRKVKQIKAKFISNKEASIEIKGEAGLYIKELVSGDQGRTKPSVAELLGPAKVKELDVIRIWD